MFESTHFRNVQVKTCRNGGTSVWKSRSRLQADEIHYGIWFNTLQDVLPSITHAFMHTPVFSSPCPVGQGWPQLAGGALPPCGGLWCWHFAVLSLQPV